MITVVDRKGSSPGIVGFKMVVSESGKILGSIGGGAMEFNMVEVARKFSISDKKSDFLKKQIHNPEALKDKSGLICSGEQTHVFTLLDQSCLEVINRITEVLSQGGNGLLSLTRNGLSFNEDITLNEKHNFLFRSANDWEYTEQLGLKPTLYIFGAGHVSLPLSKLFNLLDFNVELFDDRNNLNSFENNRFAHRKAVIDYREAVKYVPEGEQTYVVIVTFGHKSDELILRQLVSKNLKYLGMMGSKNKVRKIFESLREQKVPEELLAKVDAPIGLPIKSETTEEIAVSIAAKIIQVKNTK